MRQVLQVALASWVLGATGQLVLPGGTGTSCALTLLLSESKTSPSYYSRTIRPGAFKVDFTIEPAVRDYRLRLDCPGYEVIERSVRSNRAETRVDLGRLEPRQIR